MHRNLKLTWLLMITAAIALSACSTAQTVFFKTYPQYKGEINQHTRLVKAKPDLIFELITDEHSFAALCPPYTIVTFDTQGTFAQGTCLTTRIDHLLKFQWHSQVEEIIPNQLIRLRFLNGLFKGGTEIWELAAQGSSTKVVHTIIIAPQGIIGKFIWALKARQRHNIMVEKFLDRLKQTVESSDKGLLAKQP